MASVAPAGLRVCVVDVLTLRVGAGSQSGKAGAARVVGRMGAMRARVAARARDRMTMAASKSPAAAVVTSKPRAFSA